MDDGNRVRPRMDLCVSVSRQVCIHTVEIPEAMPAYLHLICSFSSYANDIAVAISEVFEHKVKGPRGAAKREMCETLYMPCV